MQDSGFRVSGSGFFCCFSVSEMALGLRDALLNSRLSPEAPSGLGPKPP